MALARVPSRRIITTNYDEAIEQAIREVGLEPRSFGPSRANEFLAEPPPGVVHVLHLHGIASDPAGIVLTTSSYDEAIADEAIEHGIRALAATESLVFIGHSLDPKEQDLRRNVLWAQTTFERTPPHLLLHRAGDLTPEQLASVREAGVAPLGFDYVGRPYRFTGHAAGIIGGMSALAARDEFPLTAEAPDPWYLTVPLVPYEQMATFEQRRLREQFGQLLVGPTSAPVDLEAASRLLVIGESGIGKTQLLRHLGREAPQQAVYLSLGSVRAPGPGESQDAVFLGWLEHAGTFGNGVARPVDSSALAQGTYIFLLDGLDLVKADEREEVYKIIVGVAERYPQHRFILTSRFLRLFDKTEAAGFQRYSLWPQRDWFRRYAIQRGRSSDEIDRLQERLPAIVEVCRNPLFAAAAVDLLEAQEELPTVPLGLLLHVADRGLRFEATRLRADRMAVRAWLGRLALTMELAGVVTVDRPTAVYAGLEQGLGLGEDVEQLMTHLVERTLLTEDGDQVRFPNTVIQEARAADALLAGPGGLGLLARHVLQDVGGEHGVRPSWQRSIELLLGRAPPDWREIIAAYAPVPVARTTSMNSSEADRSQAIEAILAWYRKVRVWLPRNRRELLVDDLVAVKLLAANGISQDLRDMIRTACSDKDPVVRGNAIAVLSMLGDSDGARLALPELLRDVDPVVRRRAAVVAWELSVPEVLDVLREQVRVDDDEGARGTLAQAAVALADDDKVFVVLDEVPAELRSRLWRVLNRRWDAAEQLRRFAEAGRFDEDWFEELTRHTSEWGVAEVRLVVGLLMRQPQETRDLLTLERLRPLATRHMDAALAEGVQHLQSVDDVFDLVALTGATDDALDRAAAVAPSAARTALEEYRALRQQRPTQPPPSVPPAPPPAPQLIEQITAEDIDSILARHPNSGELGALDQGDRARLRALMEQLYQRWVEEPPSGEELAWRDGPQGRPVPRLMRYVEWWAALDLPLSDKAWLRLVRLPLVAFDASESEWLRRHFEIAWADQLTGDVADWSAISLDTLAATIPPPWPAALAAALAQACFGKPTQEWIRQQCAERLAQNSQLAVLQQLHAVAHDPVLDAALVRVGDCDAETRLLTSLVRREIELPQLGSRLADHWIAAVRCRTSHAVLMQIIARLLREGTSSAELIPIFGSLHRVAGAHALDLYDQLKMDPHISEGSFLWYRRQELLDGLLEEQARQTLPASMRELGELVMSSL